MLKALTGKFYWYRMARDIHEYVGCCLTCQSRKQPQPRRQGLLQLFDFSSAQPWDDVAVDHAGPLPQTCSGHWYVLVIMDMFTRWVELVPVPDTTAETTAKAILDHWICCWGVFHSIHSDNGTAFSIEIMAKLAEDLRFKHTFTSPGHPSGNPYAERLMKPLVNALYAYVDQKKQDDWDRYLYPIQFAFNTRVHSTTGFAPFFTVTGNHPRLPSDVVVGATPQRTERDDAMPFTEALADLYSEIRERLMRSAQKRKTQYDLKHLDVTFDIDSTVMVYSEEAHRKGESTKFASKWIGPCRVIEQVTPVTYRVEHLRNGRVLLVHVNRLRKVTPYIPPPGAAIATPRQDNSDEVDLAMDPGVLPERSYQTPVASSEDDRPSYDMEYIAYKRKTGDLVEYLVKFQGYDELEWIPEEDIDGKDMIAEFERRNPQFAKKKASKRSAKNSMHQRLRKRNLASDMNETNQAMRTDNQNLRRSAHLQMKMVILHGVWAPC